MIRRTFQIVRGVGPSRERDLWSQGVACWDDVERLSRVAWASPALCERICAGVDEAQRLLKGGDLKALAHLLPSRERWRLYRDFREEAVFFDIETDGTQAQAPTVVSLFHAHGLELFVAGRNLDALPEAMARWRFWITFSGTCFDVPVLQRHFPDLPVPDFHLDLRFFARQLGLQGGLKALENRLGFGRPPHLSEVRGADAVWMWAAFQAGRGAENLRRLCEYNLYDTLQLRTLADTLYDRALDALGLDAPRVPVFDRAEVMPAVGRLLHGLG